MKKRILTALPALLLCGCQLPPQPRSAAPTPTQSAISVPKPSLQMTQLWMEGDLREASPLPFAAIRSDSDRVTFSWNGDAVELLSALSRARGMTFSYAGVRLPLPVDIEVQGVTYANVLRLIEMQTAWRATITTFPGQMVLQFMTPVSERKGARR